MPSHRLHERCACASAGRPFALAGTQRKYERPRFFVTTHLRLDLRLNFKQKWVEASADLDFERVSPDSESLELDAVGFEIFSVKISSGKKASTQAEYTYDGDRLSIRVPKRQTRGRVSVSYRAVPERGLYFLAPDDKVKDRPVQVWSQCQDEDARHWFPCQDKPHVKMTSELEVEVPQGFIAVSNGNLVHKEQPTRGPWRYHFRLDQPHPSYLVTLVVGRFDVISDHYQPPNGAPPVPVAYYVPLGRKADGRRAFAETPRMMALFSRLTGVPYAYDRYSQIVVSDFIFGGMENTTATTMYEYILFDKRASLDVTSNDLVAHELSHQWFGDLVTCRDWSHAWLNEGFATFFEHVEREDRLGRDEYDYGVLGDLQTYLSEAQGRYQRPIVCRDYDEPIDLFDRHLYEKGGLVLHMLRRLLGDRVFWAGVHRYLVEHRHGVVETTDLQRALEAESGQSLERFFDQWVFRAGHPHLKVRISYEDGLLSVKSRQAQDQSSVGLFEYDLEIEVADKSERLSRHSKRVRETEDALVVALPERPSWVAFNPELRILSRIDLEAPADMLQRQLKRAKTAVDRCQAAVALSKRSDVMTVDALGEVLNDARTLWPVRTESARALGSILGERAFSHLTRALKTPHPKVRRACASALGQFKTQAAAVALSGPAKRDPSYLVQAAACRALGKTRQESAKAPLMAALGRSSWADVVAAAAVEGLGALATADALKLVAPHAAYGRPKPARRAAIRALPGLGPDKEVLRELENLLSDPAPQLRLEVVAALQKLGDKNARAILRRQLEHELDGRVSRRIREALRDLHDKSATERRRVHEELENLRGELRAVKTRLSKLEDERKGKSAARRSAGSSHRKKPKSPKPPAKRTRLR